MAKIIQLSPHIANLIAAGEVVERPSSVAKELLENAVDAGATQVIIEIRDGGMTFMRVTDNGCGMEHEDACTAFSRHATSKLRTADDLAAISTMGFRGEALAAIASVSRIDLMTKTGGSLIGTSLHLEGGAITEDTEIGCPDGTTIIIRDLFFNTPARMKFMKSDSVEGSRVTSAVQLQALAHPEVAFRFIRDGKEVLSTSGDGDLASAIYCIYGREAAQMIPLESHWDSYTLTGYICKPTNARPSRNLQTFFVNGRPIKSRLLIAALEEAYRNQIMVGKFPTCVLHLTVPNNVVDVNVHPAKTEVKFLNEKAVFDCIHYGVLGALNKTPDRPQVQFKQPSIPAAQPASTPTAKKDHFFRTMTTEEFKSFSNILESAPQPKQAPAVATVAAIESTSVHSLRESVSIPQMADLPQQTVSPVTPADTASDNMEDSQISIPMPEAAPWRVVGELYHSYIIVEQGDEAYLIDKHAAHERILFDKLMANQEKITSQALLTPISCKLTPDCTSVLLSNTALLEDLGFEIEEFGSNTILLRQVPMDLTAEDAPDVIEQIADDLLNGRQESPETVRSEILHTVACKAAIKAGWHTSEAEINHLVTQVMAREELKYCPHGRPICISLSKKQLEKQFKRS